MKKALIILAASCLLTPFSPGENAGAAATTALDPDFGTLPLAFIPNRGQVDEAARFYARTAGFTLWLTRTALVFDSLESGPAPSREVTRLEFLGAAPAPALIPQDPAPGVANFLRGVDPERWTTGLPTSRAVLYRGVYKNIDLKVYGRSGAVEYDWIVKPGGRLEDIRFRIEGAGRTAIDADGNLVVSALHGDWTQRRPDAFQVGGGKRPEVRVDFRSLGDGAFGFSAAPYDASLPLMIDPVIALKFSTFLGGAKDDAGRAVAVSASGNVFVAGETNSLEFPVKLGFSNAPAGAVDAFVTKLAVTGKDIVFSTYIGGQGTDRALGIALKGQNAYVVGSTNSSDFPVKNAYDSTYGGRQDAFVLKLHAAGDALEYATFLGGRGADAGRAIAVDAQGSAYVAGDTNSSDFPLLGEIDGKQAGQEAFVTKLTPSGGALVYSTFLGGAGQDGAEGIALGGQGTAFVAGSTASKDFPTLKPLDGTHNGNSDAFVAGIAPSGRSLLFSTFLGGAAGDWGHGIAADAAGSVYVTGQTDSSNFPTKNAYDRKKAGKDAFVAKLSGNGRTLAYATFLGGGRADSGQAIAVQSDGTASVTGLTLSRDFPSYGGLGNSYGGSQDAFLTKLSAKGDEVLYSAYLGGKDADAAFGVAAGTGDVTYLTGATSSVNFPLKLSYDATWNGGQDAFVAKFADVDMQITGVRIRYLGMPDEVDVYGYNFGDHQGSRRLYCDGVEVPLSKTLWWGDRTISLWTSGWLYYADYWDHYYTFVIKEGAAAVSNTRTQNFLVHIDSVSPNPASSGTLLDIYGWTFNPTQGSDLLKMGSYTMTIYSWSNTYIRAYVPTAPAGAYNIYIQRGSDVISDTYAFTHN